MRVFRELMRRKCSKRNKQTGETHSADWLSLEEAERRIRFTRQPLANFFPGGGLMFSFALSVSSPGHNSPILIIYILSSTTRRVYRFHLETTTQLASHPRRRVRDKRVK